MAGGGGIRAPCPQRIQHQEIIVALFFQVPHLVNKLSPKVSCFLILESSFNFKTLFLNSTPGEGVGVDNEWEEVHLIQPSGLMIQ